jgi:hypothetical protein
MPTILLILGWRFFFYANEGNEPIHLHCRKGDMECKYWLDRENFAIEEAYSYNMGSRDKREVKRSYLNILSSSSRSGIDSGLRHNK